MSDIAKAGWSAVIALVFSGIAAICASKHLWIQFWIAVVLWIFFCVMCFMWTKKHR